MSFFHRPSKRGTKPSFVSYVDASDKRRVKASDGDSTGSRDRLSVSGTFDDDRLSMASMSGTLKRDTLTIPDDVFTQLAPDYLPGEIEVGRAARVMRYVPFSDCKQGAMGSLCVTNFRITFIPVNQDASTNNHVSCRVWRNKLYGEDDILLNNVDAAYQVSRGRRKRLVAGKHSDRSTLKKIEIHCKNFRIHQFSLECCSRDSANKVADAIAHFSNIDKVDRQFAFSYRGNTTVDPDESPNIPEFHERASWEREITRLHAKSFKVTDCNENFQDSQFMPKYFVVPSALSGDKVRRAFHSFENYGYPAWSYSHTNGASLIRMTFPLLNNIHAQDVENSYLECLKQIHPEQKKPLVYDVHETFPMTSAADLDDSLRLPGIKDIKHSFDKLRDICMSVTVKDVEHSDGSWLGAVDSTKWLAHVSSCLRVTERIALLMTGDSFDINKRLRRVSVVIKEHDGARDMAPLLTSLVQIILDPHTRTIVGFQSLVEREWVALGHRFKDRYSLVSQPDQDDRQCPVLLLFLDCVWQIMRQIPQAFQFSETFLIALWDAVCSGLFGNFLFNSQHEMLSTQSDPESEDRFSRLGDKQVKNTLLNVWDWSKQYSREDLGLLRNPLYKAEPNTPDTGQEETPTRREPQRQIRILSKYYKEKPSDCFIDLDLEDTAPQTPPPVLSPQWRVCHLDLWAACYLRWLTPVQIVGGGPNIPGLLERLIVDEISDLQKKLQSLGQDLCNGSVQEPDIDTCYSGQRGLTDSWTDLRKRRLLEATSSFPYSPSRPTAQVTFFGAQTRSGLDDLTSSSELETSTSSADMLSS